MSGQAFHVLFSISTLSVRKIVFGTFCASPFHDPMSLNCQWGGLDVFADTFDASKQKNVFDHLVAFPAAPLASGL